MTIDALLLSIGEQKFLALAGVLAGALFGALAQRSRFCMRSAVIDCCERKSFSKLAIWLLAFATALLLTQGFTAMGSFDATAVRQLTTTGTLSGAIVGGVLMGIGMILARGCPSRMLVVAANGNLRAMLTGLFFVVTAQASTLGMLSPVREWIANWWLVDAGSRNVLALIGIAPQGGLLIGLIWLAAAVYYARRSALTTTEWIGGIGVGATVAGAWWITYQISVRSFDIVVPVQAIGFTSPSTEVLMWMLSQAGSGWTFGIGLVAGVFLGSFSASVLSKEFHLEGFGKQHNLPRYLAGASCMGLGGILAGGCAVGAGVSGAAVFGVTAWTALFFMWVGATSTHLLIDHQPASA